MIEMEIEDDTAIIKLDNPPVNAVCTELLEHLDDAMDDLKQKESKAVILTGKGKAFVGGADISEMRDKSPEEARKFSRKGQKVFQRLRELKPPVIAAVNGYALGGGMEIALACDFIVSSKDAKFGQPEVGLGVIPGFGSTQRLPRLIGKAKAKELIFSGKRFGPEEAKELGIVNHVVESEDLMDEVKEIAKRIANNAPLAVRYAKEAINKGSEKDLKGGLEIEARLFGKCFESDDQKEGMAAFLDKRDPDFKGE